MKAIKIAGLTALAYVSKLLVSLFIIREIATIHGPEGLGLLGNFMTLVSLTSTLAGGGMLSGMIKYLAEYIDLPSQQQRFTISALIYTIFFACLVLGVGVCCIGSLTQLIFSNQSYRMFIYFFLVAQMFVAFNNYIFGVVIGLGKNSLYTMFLLVGNFMAFIIAYYGIHQYGLWGAVIAIMAPTVSPIIPALYYAYVSRRSFWHSWKFTPSCLRISCIFTFPRLAHFRLAKSFFAKSVLERHSIQILLEDSRLLSKFSFMRLFSVLCFPLVEILVTNQIKSTLGLESAGYWQAVMKLSLAYLTFFSMFLTFYFLPRLSSLTDRKQMTQEVKQMGYLIGGTFILMFGVLMCFKDLMIQTVLSDQFLVMGDWISLQMIGDFFRVLGWVISFVAISKAATKWYLLGEAFQGLLFMGLSTSALFYFHDVQAVIAAYALTSFLYCLLSVIIFIFYLAHQAQVDGGFTIEQAT